MTLTPNPVTDSDSAPALSQPIIGWRFWRTEGDGSLRSVCADATGSFTPWPRRAPAPAACAALSPHPAPRRDCECGWYACRSIGELARWLEFTVSRGILHPWAMSIGTVALWGRVIEHLGGWRAEYAYPQRVYTIDPGLAPAVASAYLIDSHPLAAAPGPLAIAVRRAIDRILCPAGDGR
jgi:hypothetical protein